jgi:NADH-quinone oxidoreductase subunit H
VIPLGSVIPPEVFPASWGITDPIRLIAAPGVDVGVIYVFAVGSIAVYGVVLGGWASNNKYSLFGGLRSGAQLISYELPLGLGILGVVMATGSLRLDSIIDQQASSGAWNAWMQPLGFLVFFVAGFAEAGRLPFDLPEAEQELVGGYHTEYSGIKLMMYLVAEFLHMITAAFLISILFLGGWHFWGLTGSGQEVTWPVAVLRVIVLLAKVMAVIFFFMVARWSWPRFRFDQLMALAWKVMLPLGLVNIVVVAVWVEYGDRLATALGISSAVCMAVVGWVALAVSWAVVVLVAPAECDNTPRREVPVPRVPTDGGNATVAPASRR